MGFFWDDLPYMWFFHGLGAQGMGAVFGSDRPFLGLTYQLTTSLFGVNPAAWQTFAVLVRFLCAASLWWLLVELWLKRKMLAAITALIFSVYPGFSQQWISVIYGHAFLIFTVFFTSLALMVRAARSGWLAQTSGRVFTVLSVLCAAYAMFSTEYFVGLEALRPILLWMILFGRDAQIPEVAQNARGISASFAGFVRRLRRCCKDLLLAWSPYLLLMGGFMIWRLLLHRFPGRDLLGNQETALSPQALPATLTTIFFDLVDTVLTAWRFPLQFDLLFAENSLEGLRYMGLLALIGVSVGIFLTWLKAESADKDLAATPHEAHQALWLGGLALLAGGAPFWAASLSVRMGFPWDRYTLPLSAGVALCLAGLIDLTLRTKTSKAWLAAALVALAGAYQANLALQYKQEWTNLTAFAWQLTWRAPGLQPGTLLLMEKPGFAYQEDDSLTALVNWVYAPQWTGGQMPYMVFSISERLNRYLPGLQPGMDVSKAFRAAYFEGNTSQVLVFHYAPPGCLHIFDPQFEGWQGDYPDLLLRAIPLSNLGVIERQPVSQAVPPLAVFGEEPRRRWCFYFQQADLARQFNDWDKIVQLGKDAFRQGYYPAAANEFFVFIEGYSRLQYWDDAYQITQKAYQQEAALRPALCALWWRVVQDMPLDPALERNLARLKVEPGCALP